MKALSWIAGLIFLGIPAAFAAFWAYGHVYKWLHTYAYNMRVTVEIETPQGPRVASSVIGYTTWFVPQVAIFTDQGRSVKGEAVVIDLPVGPDGATRHFIALLAGGPAGQNSDLFSDMPRRLIAWPRHTDSSSREGRERVEADLANARDRLELPTAHHPTMVTFKDLADPASAVVVYATGRDVRLVPASPGASTSSYKDFGPLVIDRFAETFGPGYALKRVTIEMTSDPVTRGIEGKVTGLRDIAAWNKKVSAWADRTRPHPAAASSIPAVGSGNFIRDF